MSSPRSVQEDYLRFDGERLSYNQDLLVWDRSTTADLDNFLSLSLLKKHLQVPESFTGQDDVLEIYIKSAVSFVEMYIGRPVLSSVKEKQVSAYGEAPMVLHERFLSNVLCVQYWSDRNAYVSGPVDQTVPNESLGRIAFSGKGRLPSSLNPLYEKAAEDSYILYPTTSWPDAYECQYVVEMDVGMSAASVGFADAQMAAILLAKNSFDGYRTITPNNAVYALLNPLREF